MNYNILRELQSVAGGSAATVFPAFTLIKSGILSFPK